MYRQFLLAATFSTLVFAQATTQSLPRKLLIKMRSGVPESRIADVLARYGARVETRILWNAVSILDADDSQIEPLRAALTASGLVQFVERDYVAKTSAVPNDPNFVNQWHMEKIQAAKAWDNSTGQNVVVAVVDSGVDGTHPDLASRLVPGWSVILGTADSSDVAGHGTAVAGTIAAAWNNNAGGAGVAPNAYILPVAVTNLQGTAAYSRLASGIQYAADRGARIINVSLGGTAPSDTLQYAVDYAWSKGSVVFAAAMNSATSVPAYPAACAHAIAVSATDSSDLLAGYSNYGAWIKLSAPGNSIFTTSKGGGYAYWSGTSLASPVAAGVAALALSRNAGLSADTLVNLLFSSAVDLGTAGFDNSFGWGRVDAAKAVEAAGPAIRTPVPVSISPATTSVVSGGSATLTFALSGPAPSGMTVAAVITGPQVVSAPATVSVVEGATSGTITVTGRSVTGTTTAYLILISGGGASLATISVTPPTPVPTTPSSNGPPLLWMILSTNSIAGGDTAAIIFQLSAPAPAGGATVALGTSNPAAASIQPSITVAQGMVIGVAYVPTYKVSSQQVVTISATSGGVTKSANLTVK